MLPPQLTALPPIGVGTDACAYAVGLCTRANEQMLRRMADAVPSLSKRERTRLVRQYLCSESARVATLYRALHHRRREIGSGRWSWQALISIGRRLDVFQPEHDPIRVGFIDRKWGDPRTVFCHSDLDYARHLLAAKAFRAVHRFHPRQFTYAGGDAGAMRWLQASLHQAELVMTTDFPDFFLSLKQERLTSVALPRRVTEAMLIGPFQGLKVSPKQASPSVGGAIIAPCTLSKGASGWCSLQDWYHHVGTCPGGLGDGWGIPPGSPLSQLYSQAGLQLIIERIEAEIEGIECGCIADNLIILLRDASAKAVVERKLAQAVRDVIRDDCQKELLRRIVPRKPKAGFNFIGRNIRLLKSGGVRIKSLKQDWDAVEVRLLGELANERPVHDEGSLITRLSARVSRFENDPISHREALRCALRVGQALANGQLDGPAASKSSATPAIEIFTDGAAMRSNGVGAWAAFYKADGRRFELTGTSPLATNNKMELQAVVEVLEAFDRPVHAAIYSDSKYVVDGAEQMEVRRQRGWCTQAGKRLANQRLWRRLAVQMLKHNIAFHWVRGHAHSSGNQVAHDLAATALRHTSRALANHAGLHAEQRNAVADSSV